MIIVVDTNIVFSAILSPNGTISDLLLNSSNTFEFFAPDELLNELESHHQKLLKLSRFSEEELNFMKRMILKKIDFIDLESIPKPTWENALALTKAVDEFDTPFIALSLELKSLFWTGDKKLIKELNQKGINWVLTSDMLKEIRDKHKPD